MANYSDYSEDYADCYEFITQHKNYAEEAKVLLSFLDKSISDGKILSVGCGIGSHEFYLAKHGLRVFGIDKSECMIKRAIAKSNEIPNLSFGHSFESLDLALELPLGCVISLFNVINCLPSLVALSEFFHEIFVRMKPGGIFFFEAWNGLECMLKPPKEVVRVFDDSNGNCLNRDAKPKLSVSKQHLQIQYYIKGTMAGRQVETTSVHDISLFTINEILYMLGSVGFKNVEVFSSLPSLEPFNFESTNPPRMLSFAALA
ncbi:bifunctional 2-polyprenyl-6-hydroxyphenol methylase/3-demethylubiquinol 3-O-methyltransferase UbiG [Synechococcus sp. NOUM97013]|uniref:class I SAM-dependent methyltransferase n=1 Tax=Synechococcus sp. NOUM97013 TaxID=1442555 RepID=UPI001646BB6B|nr:class I SAM-dependent methyltransferase [Synechococcus sp. NOUM97013]QNI72324.1 tellurite resistance TehB family protein [Synechococcus sp. NOUM97013]